MTRILPQSYRRCTRSTTSQRSSELFSCFALWSCLLCRSVLAKFESRSNLNCDWMTQGSLIPGMRTRSETLWFSLRFDSRLDSGNPLFYLNFSNYKSFVHYSQAVIEALQFCVENSAELNNIEWLTATAFDEHLFELLDFQCGVCINTAINHWTKKIHLYVKLLKDLEFGLRFSQKIWHQEKKVI